MVVSRAPFIVEVTTQRERQVQQVEIKLIYAVAENGANRRERRELFRSADGLSRRFWSQAQTLWG